MEAKLGQSFQFSSWINPEKLTSRSSYYVNIMWGYHKQHHPGLLSISPLQKKKTKSWYRPVQLEISCSFQNSQVSKEFQSVKPSFENDLKKKSQIIMPYLNGRSIYLVGMMGSGKTTLGKLLSENLNYSFVDCDILVERAVGGISVPEIFRYHGEPFFRDKESEALEHLSLRKQLVVSTGGGAVIRPANWTHMRMGISVWLDVPLETLAWRIAAVGTNSRPLLQEESGDVFEKTYRRLRSLWEERKDAYANANAWVSFKNIATLDEKDVLNLTPPRIAFEVMQQIHNFLKKEEGMKI